MTDLDAYNALWGDSVFTFLFNISGQPAISLPLGEVAGLPAGVQFVGTPRGRRWSPCAGRDAGAGHALGRPAARPSPAKGHSCMTHDLVLNGGRVIDPASGTDATLDVAFAGRQAWPPWGRGSRAREVRDVKGAIVTPGLIDLHTHVYWGGTSLGVEADAYARQSAVTTSVDTGSAGPGNFPGFRAHVIDRAQSRVLVYLHVSFAGIYAFSPTIMVGESHDMRLMAAREAAAVAEANRDVIIGIKVRVGRNASGPSGITPLDVALDVADRTGLPSCATSTNRRRPTRRWWSGCAPATSSPIASAPSRTRRCMATAG
jgi:hypothetical protein